MSVDATDPQETQAALDRLAEELAGSDFRAAITKNPTSAARAAGINVDALPDGLLGTLGLMGDEELKIVARVQQSFEGSIGDAVRVAILF